MLFGKGKEEVKCLMKGRSSLDKSVPHHALLLQMMVVPVRDRAMVWARVAPNHPVFNYLRFM